MTASQPTVHLHIGTMKTGTSYLQAVMTRNAAVLSEHGVLYPTGVGHNPAVRQLLGLAPNRPSPQGAWERLLQKVQAWDGRDVIVSSELLSFASVDQVNQVVKALLPAPVHVIVGARDLARTLPSAWQNKVKHGRGWEFTKYVERVQAGPTGAEGPARSFWHHHDIAEIVSRWASAVGASNVTILTVPRSRAEPFELWRRFCQVLDLPPGQFDAAPDRESNLSLNYAQTELLRRVNRLLREDLDKEAYRRHVLTYFANTVLRPDPQTRDVDEKPMLSVEMHDWAVERSERMVADLQGLGTQVVGDLRELVPAPLIGEQRDAEEQSSPEIPDAVVRAVAKLLLRVVRLQRGQPLSELDDDEPSSRAETPDTWHDDEDDDDDDPAADLQHSSDGLPSHRNNEDGHHVPPGMPQTPLEAPRG